MLIFLMIPIHFILGVFLGFDWPIIILYIPHRPPIGGNDKQKCATSNRMVHVIQDKVGPVWILFALFCSQCEF